jgi:HSP20 family protein
MFYTSPSNRAAANHFARFAFNPAVHAALAAQANPFDRNADATQHHAAANTHSVQVDSDDTSVTLSLDVPGLAKDQVTVRIEANVVRITSKDDAPRSFKAAYQLADEIDAAVSQAKLENGVLTLKLGKLTPVSRETVLAVS